MLFHQQSFILVFLPIILIGYIISSRYSKNYSLIFIIFSSLYFYGYHSTNNIVILLFSILFNYNLGIFLLKIKKFRNLALIFGIIFNLSLILTFKYINFLILNLNLIFSFNIEEVDIEIPLAISFFTFQQIAFLVDLHKGSIKPTSFIKYTFFIVFFPQLIAGPIVRFQNIIKQLNKAKEIFNYQNVYTGFSLFSFGLFKKHFLADGVKPLADSLFDMTTSGLIPSITEAWIGSVSFGLQIYFDFSAYSDMAIGLALILGFRLPLNFNSPYKSKDIVDFWRSWHITLSEFLRDYLYFPLGGNRKGIPRGLLNAMIVMLLGGLWHGASWTFVIWGAFHGMLIGITHILRILTDSNYGKMKMLIHHLLLNKYTTFILVTISWVLFRSENLQDSLIIFKSMFGFNGIDLGRSFSFLENFGLFKFNGFLPNKELDITLITIIPIFLIIVFYLPNLNEILKINNLKLEKVRPPSKLILFISGILFFLSVKISIENTIYEFIYFQF